MLNQHNQNNEGEQVIYDFNDEIDDDIPVDVVKIQLSMNVIQIDYFKLWRWSKLIKKEYPIEDINSHLSQDIQQYQQKYNIKEENTILFFNSISNEKVQISKEKYFDFLKLATIFQVTTFLKILRKYAENHLIDVDDLIDYLSFENNSEENPIRFSKEIEENLIININQCLQSRKFEQLPISVLYRIIEKSRQNISDDYLFEFIKKSINERCVLLSFINIRNLSNQKFNELYENLFTNQNNHKFVSYLPCDLHLLKTLKEENDQLKNNNLQLQHQNTQMRRTIEELQSQLNNLIDSYKILIEDLINEIDFDQENPPKIHNIILPLSVKTKNPQIVKSLCSIQNIDVNSHYKITKKNNFFYYVFFAYFINQLCIWQLR